jgi:hypothetical protein
MTQNASQYIVRQILAPTVNGLLLNAVALTIKNITAAPTGQAIGIAEIGGQPLFTGTNAGSGSLWGVQRMTATPAAGTVLVPFSCHPGAPNPSSLVEVRFSDTGTITGVAPGAVSAYHLGIASQIGTAPLPLYVQSSEDNPLITIGPGDCLVVYAATAIVPGSRITLGIRWFMVNG